MRLRKFIAPPLTIAFAASVLVAQPANADTFSHTDDVPDAYVVDIFATPSIEDIADDAEQPGSVTTDDPTEQPSDHVVDAPIQQPSESDLVEPHEGSPKTTPLNEDDEPESNILDEPEPDATSTSAIAPASFSGDAIVTVDTIADYDLISAPLATEQFNVAAVTWTGGQPASIEIRTEAAGIWGDWYALEIENAGAGNTSGTEPYIATGSSGIQVRAMYGAQPTNFELVLLTGAGTQGSVEESEPAVAHDAPHEDTNTDAAVNVSAGPELLESLTVPAVFDGEAALPVLASSPHKALSSTLPPKNVQAPAIVTRSVWGAPEQATWRPSTANLEGAVIHHTAGNNSYTPAESPAIVRSIWNYHSNTRGWGDIGYNFLVDKYGTIFEGREGSRAAAPGTMTVGAHAAPANTGTVGISVMGTYTTASPEPIVLERLSDVIAWQFGTAGINPTTTWEHRPATGQPTVTMNRIIGHMEVANTACPGLIMNSLPTIGQTALQKISSGGVPQVNGQTGTIAIGLEYATVRATSLHREPTSASDKIKSVANQSIVVTTRNSFHTPTGTWWQVTHGNTTGWMRFSDLTHFRNHAAYGNVRAGLDYYVVRATAGHSAPDTTGTSLVTLTRNDKAVTTGERFGQYWKVDVQGVVSWVPWSDLKNQPHGVAGKIRTGLPYSPTSSIPLFRSPLFGGTTVATVPYGEIVVTEGENFISGNQIYWKVRFGNQTGWADYNLLRNTSNHPLSSTIRAGLTYYPKSQAQIFEIPSENGKTLGSIPSGEAMTTTSTRFDGFWQVEYRGRAVWVKHQSLTNTPPQVARYSTITSGLQYAPLSVTTLRTNPWTSASTVLTIDQRDVVTTTRQKYQDLNGTTWWRVQTGTVSGWIPMSDLVHVSKHPQSLTIRSGLTYYTTIPTAMQALPSSRGSVLSSMQCGTAVTTTDQRFGEYWRVEKGGKWGWVRHRDLRASVPRCVEFDY